MDRILNAVDRFSACIGKSVGVLGIVASVVTVYEVFMRYMLNRPTVWASETTAFVCCIMYVLAGAWLIREDAHVRVDLLYASLSPRTRALVNCLTYPFFALYIIALLWAFIPYTVESVQLRESTTSAWDPPIYPIKIIILFGVILVVIQGTVQAIRNLRIVLRKDAQ